MCLDAYLREGRKFKYSYLFLKRFFVIGVDMTVTNGMNEFAWFEARDMRDHQRQQRVAGNVERYS